MSDPTPKRRRRACIVCDEVKERHTTHWDLDALTQAELEAAFNTPAPAPKPAWRNYLRAFALTALIVAVVAFCHSTVSCMLRG